MQRILSLCFTFVLSLTIAHAQLIPPGDKYPASVAPLIQTNWGQGKPYNNKCPERVNAKGEMEHCPVGCVALALGQIMKFWNYPERGAGSTSYKFIVEVSANFGETTYDWAHMRNSYWLGYNEQDVDAVATLLYHCGAAVGMMYALSGSSAFAYQNIPRNLTTNFLYSTDSIRYLKRSDYSKEEWMDIIYHELSQGRPIFYSGSSPTSGIGHAWVVDGYNEKGEVHINWGWKGSGNGYFDIDLDDPAYVSKEEDYNLIQSMVVGIYPPNTSTSIVVPFKAEPTLVGIYSLDGRKLDRPQHGINIFRYSDGTSRKQFIQ